MKNIFYRTQLPPFRTLVIKVGSRIVASGDGYKERVSALVEDIAQIRASGVKVALVSSGAIAFGMRMLALKSRPSTIPLKQACASVGQVQLMQLYVSCFSRHKINSGQVLLTWDDLRNKKRYLNLRNTLFNLFNAGAVPVINENDSVATDEIRFGDNDTLAAQIALLIQADLFVILTDVSGLYSADPKTNPEAEHIGTVEAIDKTVHMFAQHTSSQISVGGMITKLKAAETVNRAGIYAIIGNGFNTRLLNVIANEKAGTLFIPKATKMRARHRWIAFAKKISGYVVIDSGAQEAIILKGKSLLPAGIIKVVGMFSAGDTVEIQNTKKEAIAVGLVNYSSEELKKIAGHKTHDIITILGNKLFDEAIHRDNIVFLT